ncbi:MAG TPA: diacylglycerol kinase family protein [Pengzhenrongella sp.]
MSWSERLSLIAVLLAVGALVVAMSARGSGGARAARRLISTWTASIADSAGSFPEPDTRGELIAFVANPTKPGARELREAAVAACSARSMPPPLWFETTLQDGGVGQTRAAIERGATAVVAVGGDGTVRAVAEALAGSGVPMGLIPQGTGNLLARNLDLPLANTVELLRLALTGTGRTIDVGWLRVVRDGLTESDEPPRDHIFLVIAGVGFDAAMVADTDEDLKARVGWIAYFVAGARHLHGRRLRLRLQVDDSPHQSVQVRSLLIGNCGRLPGGITLLPDAVLDDGWFDIGAIDTRGGLVGWAQLFGEVVLQGIGVRTGLPGKIGRIDHLRARRLHVSADRPEAVQVDGDTLGFARELTVRIDPGALIVRTPRQTPTGH